MAFKQVNKYRVTVIGKYKDFDGTERESRTTKTVYAKTEQGAIGQVTKAPKKNIIPPDKTHKEIQEKWNDTASKYINDKQITVELLESDITVAT